MGNIAGKSWVVRGFLQAGLLQPIPGLNEIIVRCKEVAKPETSLRKPVSHRDGRKINADIGKQVR
jgi:hypothetical protein